ncbi:MAG: hypothetical protein ACXAE3_07680 [Candidatus Kariarchaeaceae archaeon]|jgi:hypothetical protein
MGGEHTRVKLMVKNLSNPLNARKVAQIIADDCINSGINIDARDISVFLSDHRISDLETALKQLKNEQLLPQEYFVSEACRDILLEEEFIDEHHQITQDTAQSPEAMVDLLGDIDTGSVEFRTQYESLKNKLVKTSSGGISIEGHELDNFDRKFGRPMKYFTEYLLEQGNQISDLQSFAVVYATDHLSLGDNSKEDIYYLMFDRFDQISAYLESALGFRYSWPVVSGTSFIELGKRFSVAPELSEFAKKFRGISGLDTYPDHVIQYLFYQMITGPLIDEMVAKKIIFRWADTIDDVSTPLQYLIPPPDFNMDRNLREMLTQALIAHTLLFRIDPESHSLQDVIDEVRDLDPSTRSTYLAKKLEAALTRRTVALQFGTTLANFLENFKTNPAKVTPFLDVTLRYYSKTETIKTLLATLEHSVRTGLKNSTGLVRQHLKKVSDDDVINSIHENMTKSMFHAIEQTLPEFENIIVEKQIDYLELDRILRGLNPVAIKTFFLDVLDQIFGYTSQYAKSFDQEATGPVSSEGGMTELTQDFLSTANYHGSKNWDLKTFINNMVENGLDSMLAERICYISSYITYQVASKEGSNGESMLLSLIKHYESKAHTLANHTLQDGSLLNADETLLEFLTSDLQQAHALVSVASKLKTDTYNAWTPLQGGLPKHTRYINKIVIPNLLYWQRQPRQFIMNLVDGGKLDRSAVRDLVHKTNRLSLLEAYSLLAMGGRADINSFEAATTYLTSLFQTDIDAFMINPRSGEAELAREAIYLWLNIQEGSV